MKIILNKALCSTFSRATIKMSFRGRGRGRGGGFRGGGGGFRGGGGGGRGRGGFAPQRDMGPPETVVGVLVNVCIDSILSMVCATDSL